MATFVYNLNTLSLEWCTILCIENQKRYVTQCKDLETDLHRFVTEEDLTPGGQVVWRYNGTLYTAEVIEVHGKCSQKAHYWCSIT